MRHVDFLDLVQDIAALAVVVLLAIAVLAWGAAL